MSGPSAIEPSPSDIGGVDDPVFAVTPDPATLFSRRAARLRTLAPGHPLQDYLNFLAGLSDAQHAVQDGLAPATAPAAETLARATEFGMPPIDPARVDLSGEVDDLFQRLLALCAPLPAPDAASAARARLAADPALRSKTLAEALEASASADTLAEHVFASAALQAHFARLAAALDASALRSVGTGACPCCGGPPVASLVVSWAPAHGVRYVACALCSTLWNHVRVKCVVCDSTKGVAYRGLAADGDMVDDKAHSKKPDEVQPSVRAETCDECRCYVKIMSQNVVPDIDPIADDVASLGLDLKVREAGWARAAFNPFLLGY